MKLGPCFHLPTLDRFLGTALPESQRFILERFCVICLRNQVARFLPNEYDDLLTLPFFCLHASQRLIELGRRANLRQDMRITCFLLPAHMPE